VTSPLEDDGANIAKLFPIFRNNGTGILAKVLIDFVENVGEEQMGEGVKSF
jgi:hypothetical protein